jgi:hypothetical protein
VCVWQACPSLKPRGETHPCELLFLWISELSCPLPAALAFPGSRQWALSCKIWRRQRWPRPRPLRARGRAACRQALASVCCAIPAAPTCCGACRCWAGCSCWLLLPAACRGWADCYCWQRRSVALQQHWVLQGIHCLPVQVIKVGVVHGVLGLQGRAGQRGGQAKEAGRALSARERSRQQAA